ncbi:hypothetical protein DV495_000971 [Geotrichum candidum]|uniref:Small ribosomal subunit protein mS33 n=1 Tax=Geotrichum candidum TaxID=1173061 RepID=A0A0J9X5F0_GEOCN|nr:hypothetical protein DV454_001544 [Geotrichum candidum]KAI9214883.1 hypothetical protein DS838_000214 [Geotrichum bryndzae]KAF5121336.1 hypothetical protein DV452_000914 [Geotrichum candidum]KAF5135341.1 hypothetical protein DV495_000971 [Geotrichum candidum]KAF7501224.1 hypothetical protein DV113_000796 [Geotrichum candidum]
MSTPSRARLVELTKLSKQIFHESFNPEQTRRGTRVLRSALRGPQVANYYYPNYFPTFKQMRLTHPDLYLVDMKEQYRLDINNDRRRRGKGAPPKSKGPKDEKGKKKK